MLYFLHHPAGNIVIRTTNPFIVLQSQHKGYLTNLSFSDVLSAHPEWRDPEPPAPAKKSAASLFSAFLRSFVAVVPAYAPTGVSTATQVLGSTSQSQNQEDKPDNTSPLHWLTAVERKWWWERGLQTPEGSWIMCTEGDEAFDYRLEDGIWDVEGPPEYTVRDQL